jgi:ATP/maltotriose-dependent transcriptional regulator MalT
MDFILTRLFKPIANQGHFLGNLITDKFRDNLYKRLHVVMPPGGYGKVVLIKQWAEVQSLLWCINPVWRRKSATILPSTRIYAEH